MIGISVVTGTGKKDR